MCGEVKFKDFRKASIPKFDSSKNDSFVHWYKLFCSTCLQWGMWCPPYESAQEDSIYGKWWLWLPALFKSGRSAIYLQQRIKQIITEYTDIKGVNTQKSKLIVVLGESGESELSGVSTTDVALNRTVWYDQYKTVPAIRTSSTSLRPANWAHECHSRRRYLNHRMVGNLGR
jgi:hypothetical protein